MRYPVLSSYKNRAIFYSIWKFGEVSYWRTKNPLPWLRQRIHTQNKPARYTDANDLHRAFCKFKTYNQLLVVWNKCFRTAFRQVSRLIDHHICRLPRKRYPWFPVTYRLLLPNYGDEFVQDLHLFPFSPKPMLILVPRIVLTPVCFLFNCTKYNIFFLNVKNCE